MKPPESAELQQIYANRFAGKTEYRTRVWEVLAQWFGRFIPANSAVLDLGAGYCEFINQAQASVKYAMDLNPDVAHRAKPGIQILQQDCSEPWPLAENSLDAVFTSNFLEHLPDKAAVSKVLENAYRCLKPGGRFIAMGPNIKCVPGEYWDFFDHYVPLTEVSLAEALRTSGFRIEVQVARFLPYTMAHGGERPIWMLKVYLSIPAAWRLFGKQFLVIAAKPGA